jgi:hypothetical protein
MTATLCERTFAYGKARYRVDGDGTWYALFWGWFPFGHSPRYQWVQVKADEVPKAVLLAAAKESA